MVHKKHPFPINPSYGDGSFRRRVRLMSAHHSVTGVLTDTYHKMHCTLVHDEVEIKAVTGEMLRIPNSLCPGAVNQLQELVGWPLSSTVMDLYAGGRARRHCTHLLDLAASTISLLASGDSFRVFDIVVPDELDTPVIIEVRCNGLPVHSWTVRHSTILEPIAYSGKSLVEGFVSWARTAFSGLELDAGLMLSRSYLIASGRAYLTDAWKGQPLSLHTNMVGACFSYAPERVQKGVFLGNNVRDFSESLDEDV